MQKFRKSFSITLFNNILGHYDKSLYVFIAPFIAPLFYPNAHPITALIFSYLPVNIIFRPLGAIFFGYFGDKYGKEKALFLSIAGLSSTMLAIGLVPTYASIGILSVFCIHFLRGMISFFAAGEGTAAAFVLIDGVKKKYKDLFSSIYEMSSILGFALASGLTTFLLFQDKITSGWRVLFALSGLLGFISLYFRKIKPSETLAPTKKLKPIAIKENLLPFIAIVLLTGFTCSNYRIMSSLMNGYIPHVSSISNREVMKTQAWLMAYNILMLPVFGYLSKRFSKEKIITFALLLALIFSIPTFNLLHHPTLSNVFLLRIVLMTWGLAIAAPFEYWVMDLIGIKERFRIATLAKAIGSQWIGATAAPVSLWVFQKTNWIAAPSLYLVLTASSALGALLLLYGRELKRRLKAQPNHADDRKEKEDRAYNNEVNELVKGQVS